MPDTVKTYEGTLVVRGDERFAIVASRFNHFVVDRLVEGREERFGDQVGIDEAVGVGEDGAPVPFGPRKAVRGDAGILDAHAADFDPAAQKRERA